MNDKKLIGFKDGMAVYVTDALLAEKGEREVREQFGLIRRYPVITDLSGHEVMVEGDSHEDAVQRYSMKDQKIMRLYHATTQKKAKLYRQSGAIHALLNRIFTGEDYEKSNSECDGGTRTTQQRGRSRRC